MYIYVLYACFVFKSFKRSSKTLKQYVIELRSNIYIYICITCKKLNKIRKNSKDRSQCPSHAHAYQGDQALDTRYTITLVTKGEQA